MEIRNIQRTGDMHYVYLPTSWCREHKITSKSKVSIEQNTDGSISLSPELTEKKPKHLKIHIAEDDPDVIHKLVVSSYINPVSSFEINIDKDIDLTKLINQKRLISLESVEIDKKQITSDGIITVSDPNSLLKTMVKKVKNLIILMRDNYDQSLIERYEDEIDRSKMLIDKAVIGSLSFGKITKIKNIELYYISLITNEIERTVDMIIRLDKGNKKFLVNLIKPIELLQNIMQNTSKLDQKHVIEFTKSVLTINEVVPNESRFYEIGSIRYHLNSISEVLMDWMVTIKIDN